ncbi:MAG: glycerate kinase [Pyrinomonadaceae bacterium]
MENDRLKDAARKIFYEALDRVDAGDAVRNAVRSDGETLWIRDEPAIDLSRPIYVVAIGKAAYPMAAAFDDVAGDHIKAGVVSGVRSTATSTCGPALEKFYGGHPLPNEESIEAATACLKVLDQASGEKAPVVFLISGGGSAMMELSRDPRVMLSHLIELNKTLITSGASIAEINVVRRAVSAVKGGGLAIRAANSQQFSLIVSDTRSDDVTSVASGPSLLPSRGTIDPLEVIERHGLAKRIPEVVLRSLGESDPDPDVKLESKYEILLDNQRLDEAAAEAASRMGFFVGTDDGDQDEMIDVGVERLVDRAFDLRKRSTGDEPICFISGGEFACPVKGNGTGGRNCETVLRAALQSDKLAESKNFAILSAGSDGIDGNSPAAGGVIDGSTLAVARSMGLDPLSHLEASDSYTFLKGVGAAIETGPTGTNVRDLRIVILE